MVKHDDGLGVIEPRRLLIVAAMVGALSLASMAVAMTILHLGEVGRRNYVRDLLASCGGTAVVLALTILIFYALTKRAARFSEKRMPAESEDPSVGAAWDVNVEGAPATENGFSRERLLLAGKLFDSIAEGIVVTDAGGDILMVNGACERITGYSSDECIGRNPRLFKSEHHDRLFYKGMWDALLSRGEWKGEIWNRRKLGTVYPEWLSITAIRDTEGKVTRYVAVSRDISDLKAKDAAIDRLSNRDALTDLPNRLLSLDLLAQALRLAQRDGSLVALVYIDLDGFKNVNNSYGYRTGDKVIQAVAIRITSSLRKADIVARVSGDEFPVLLMGIGKVENAVHAAEAMLDLIKQPMLIDGTEIFLTASAGISFWPGDGSTPDELVTNASAAVNTAKEDAVGCYHVYTRSIGERIIRRLDLEGKLRRAIERDELVLFFQPRLCLKEQRVCAMEALVRWKREDGSLMLPSQFIPLAEETGLIVPLGEWVLYKALERCRAWREKGSDLVVSVNISPRQFRDAGVEGLVERALAFTGFSADRLELEITESLAMADIGRTTALLTALSARGLRFSLDDFGTGYSSLYYLKRLPIQWLKIDQSFVRDIEEGGSPSNSIVATIVAMARNLGLGTIAEGCETVAHYRFLMELGCDQVQGFLIAEPLCEDGFSQLLAGGAPMLDKLGS